MEKDENRINEKKNGFSTLKLDLSNKNITSLNTSTLIPPNITELYISNNKLNDVPDEILNLRNIKVLDLSFNNIEYFDNTPNFYETLEYLDLSNNKLLGPPHWVWTSNPSKLNKLNLSSNIHITEAFQNGYFEELLKYDCLVQNIIIYNCNLKKHKQLIGTFKNAKLLEYGTSNICKFCHTNKTDTAIWKILENMNDLEILNLSNTAVWYIEPSIGLYKNIKLIDLSYNEISKLPDEFCDIKTLEVCILSHNYIMYLPDKLFKLENLNTLIIDSNELCMLPICISQMPCLRKLDLYNNFLNEIPDGLEKFDEIDLAMNYFEEPSHEEYEMRKEKLRSNVTDRFDGRKNVEEKSDDEDSHFTDDELVSCGSENRVDENRPPSSPEDWDSDEYWIPHLTPKTENPQSPWIFFVKKKINEGNFCPIDNHIVPIADQVKYEKLCNPTIDYETDGQFDDLSDDAS